MRLPTRRLQLSPLPGSRAEVPKQNDSRSEPIKVLFWIQNFFGGVVMTPCSVRGILSMAVMVLFLNNPALQADTQHAERAHEAGDYKTAFTEFLGEAQKRNAVAQGWLGLMYYRGEGVSKDYQEALKWFQEAAQQQDPRGLNGMGILHQYGRAVKKDYAKALEWYRRSAELGYAAAKNNIGYMYEEGLGLPQDIDMAAILYRESAEQGYGMAQNNLGLLYAKGKGVKKDGVQAHMWLNLAVSNGFKPAEKWLKRVEKELTPEQVVEAKRLAQDWVEKSGRGEGEGPDK